MPDEPTTTVRVYEADKEVLNRLSDKKEVPVRDVVADLVEDDGVAEHRYRCSECGEPFLLEDVDTSTVREEGLVEQDMRHLMRGQRTVKDFECPRCNERVTPGNLEMDSAVSTDALSQESE